MTTSSDSASRRSRLIGLKLRTLVRDHLGDDTVPEPSEFAPGAALLHRNQGWVFADDRPGARLGASLAWAIRAGATALHVVAESDTEVLARRATEFDLPITVWSPVDRELHPAEPAPPMVSARAPEGHERFRSLIADGGADPVVEHGVLAGEVRGLEVCRVVDDPVTGATRLEVGVGAHDREAFQMLHGDVPTVESLARIARTVADHRRVGAPQHPLNRIAAERFVRWRLEQNPSIVGALALEPAAPPVPRVNLKDPVPCVAHGTDADGRLVVVACASGVDLDVVPFAADARLAAEAAAPGVGGEARLVVALPSRDRVKVIGEIADRLRHSLSFASVD